MTPSARMADAILLLDQIIDAARTGGAAADTLAQRFFASRRYAGSKDRRAIRALVWAALRQFADIPPSGRAAMVTLADTDADLAAMFDGVAYGAPPISQTEARAVSSGVVPAVLAEELYPWLGDDELAALVARAPVDVRWNRLHPRPEQVAAGGTPLREPLSGWRFPAGTDLSQDRDMLAGRMEIQDAGSQWIVEACAAEPAMQVVDLCAGAGGKSLALWAAMAGRGSLLACDSDRRRLGQLRPRAERAGAHGIETRLLSPPHEARELADWQGRADLVLVDAPCSGSGTWRRNPEGRWRITRDSLARLVAQQERLLDLGSALVRPGGSLVYAVCALTTAEGDAVVRRFLRDHAGWQAADIHGIGLLPPHVGRSTGTGIVLTPAHDECDGFFFARLQAP